MSKREVLQSTLLISMILLAGCNKTSDSSAEAAASAAAASAAADTTPAASTDAASPAVSPDANAAAASPATPAPQASPAAASAPASTIPPPKGFPAGPTPVEGTDYVLIDTPEQTVGDKVQVTEVFGYGCPHCNALQPHLSDWEKKLPSDVEFSYVPAPFGPGMPHCWDEFARAFYAAQAMGIQVKSHDGIYKAVWDQHRFNACTDIPAIYADYGADPKGFASTMQSFAVNAKLASSHEQIVRWGVDSTPTVVVDGKYRVQEEVASGPDGMLHTIDWLIAKQRPEHAKH